MKAIIVLLIASLLAIAASQKIVSIDHDISIQSSQQYLQYVQAIIGVASEKVLQENQDLANLVKNQRISVLSAIQKVVLVLTSQQMGSQSESANKQISFDLKQAKILDQIHQNFQIVNLVGQSKEQVNEKIIALQKAGNQVNILTGVKQPIATPNRRMLQTTTSSYILKFFFSLMFIIVTVGILLSISNMQNGKDTLLYAKFIADVGR